MEGWAKTCWLTALVLSSLSSVHPVLAAPSRTLDDDLHNATHPFAEFGVSSHKARGNVALRILSLGASIMSGTGSTTGNGLRKPLRDALRLDGWEVDLVGSLHGGSMVDHEHEAVPGDVLTQVLARVPHSTGFKPNVVIINAGTNDANGAVDPPNAGTRMNNILNTLWNSDGMSDTCIMLSTLIPTTNANGATYQGTINDQYRSLVTQRAAEGKCIYLADMWPNGEQWFQFDTDYLATESPHVHPNDKGHKMMASVFYNSIQSAIADNRIVAAGTFETGSSICDKVGGTGVDAGGLTQRGSGYDDGIYYHASTEEGILWTATSSWDRGQWKFARLFDQNYDDLLAWINDTSTSQHYAVWANSGDGKASFTQMSDMDGDLDCQYTEGVNFIDMNGDGLDDLVYIDADGNAYLSINQGDGDRAAGKSPTFKRVSDTALIMATKGYKRSNVVLADVDGDGRGDYGVVDSSGNVYFWRNGWIDDIPAYWQSLGQRFTGKGYGDVTGTRFEDINGDGRDDYIWLNDVGAGYLWTNARSCIAGVEGDGLNIAWREGFLSGQSSGVTYKGMGGYVTDDETFLRDRIYFARIYGQATIFGNLPKQDFVFMQHTALSGGKHQFDLRVWKNTGDGATKLLADGDRYCNMMGHSNGMSDYVWMYSFGTMEMWANRGKGTISDSDTDGYWAYQGTIWTPPSNLNRKDLHLQDWDGDGDCDIIYADPDTGAVRVWINNYSTTGNWNSWTETSNSALTCDQHRGLGFSDLAVRFADISGNGRADYLCIEPDSTVHGNIHNDDGSFGPRIQIKVSISKDRANLRWADVNGDGLDDMLWVEKFSGDTYVWYNQGPGDPSALLGSSYSWREQDEMAYAGNAEGNCEYFTDIDGDGYADEHYILGTFTNEARTSLAPGCGLTDVTGDDASMDGDLPTVPGS
ncbi:family 3 carbohydrate esterase, partial [Xylariales sp. PMI_506]